MLEADGITAGYAGPPVIHDVTLTVNGGEIVGLVGRNASGKSTVLRALMGVVRLHHGRVSLLGRDIAALSTRKRIRVGLGYMPQGGRLFPDLTVEQNIQLYLGEKFSYDSMFDQMLHWDMSLEIKEGRVFASILRLLGRHREKTRNLSGGEKQLISIARTLLHPSQFLLLDEPSIGLSRALLTELGEILRRFSGTGVGIILVDQNVDWIMEVTGRIYIMHEGTVTATGNSMEFKADRQRLYRAFGIT